MTITEVENFSRMPICSESVNSHCIPKRPSVKKKRKEKKLMVKYSCHFPTMPRQQAKQSKHRCVDCMSMGVT